MTGGTGTADVLTSKTSPSGKLPDTIVRSVSDYPSDANFGDNFRNIYAEDIYVGYRYFETFAKDKVLYPFGFGLSYTDFKLTTDSAYEENGTLYPIEIKKHADPQRKDVDAFSLLDKLPGIKRGPGGVVCLYDRLITLRKEDMVIPINYL